MKLFYIIKQKQNINKERAVFRRESNNGLFFACGHSP